MNNTIVQTVPVTAETLRRAADLQASIETQQAELNALLAGQVFAAPKSGNGRHGRRKLPPSSVQAIREGQRKRWLKFHREQKAAAKVVAAPVPATAAPAPVAKESEPVAA